MDEPFTPIVAAFASFLLGAGTFFLFYTAAEGMWNRNCRRMCQPCPADDE
jgi:hypothetical protein